MSGIFVDDNDFIEIVVWYHETPNGTIEVLEKQDDHSHSLSMKFKRPSFGTSQAVLNSSTMLGQDGQVTANMMTLRTNILYTLAKSWDAKDDKSVAIPLNTDTISKMRVEIAKPLIEKLLEKLGTNVF